MLGTSQRRLAVRPLQQGYPVRERCSGEGTACLAARSRIRDGYRHIHVRLKRESFPINNKRIDRLYRERACRSQSIVPTAGHARVPEAFPERIRHLIGSLVPEPCRPRPGQPIRHFQYVRATAARIRPCPLALIIHRAHLHLVECARRKPRKPRAGFRKLLCTCLSTGN